VADSRSSRGRGALDAGTRLEAASVDDATGNDALDGGAPLSPGDASSGATVMTTALEAEIRRVTGW
jgi:hypothetical protein